MGKGDIWIHLKNGRPAVYDARTERIEIAGEVVARVAQSLQQIQTERRHAMRRDMATGETPVNYGHIRITRAR